LSDIYYSESFATPIAGLGTPLSRIIEILKARTKGMSLNAISRTFDVSKKSVIDWERRLAGLKPTLMLYALLHKFIHQEIEVKGLLEHLALLRKFCHYWFRVYCDRGHKDPFILEKVGKPFWSYLAFHSPLQRILTGLGLPNFGDIIGVCGENS
jgi:hypothetical protein